MQFIEKNARVNIKHIKEKFYNNQIKKPLQLRLQRFLIPQSFTIHS